MSDKLNRKPKIAFFGTPDFAVWVLEGLKEKNILPDLIISAPDAPKGRKLILTPPDVKIWADKIGIKTIQPNKIRTEQFEQELKALCPKDEFGSDWDLFIVAAYGKIIPENILYMPRAKTINVHPSLLPLLRGSSPLQTAILEDMKDTGVTIMELDKEMDHGPILAQKILETNNWPIDFECLGKNLAKEGAFLIADNLEKIISGEIVKIEQKHELATYTKKITKEDGLIDLNHDSYKNYLKFNAYKIWPGTFFFAKLKGKDIRIKIKNATYKDGKFEILTVIPEGKNETDWNKFKTCLDN